MQKKKKMNYLLIAIVFVVDEARHVALPVVLHRQLWPGARGGADRLQVLCPKLVCVRLPLQTERDLVTSVETVLPPAVHAWAVRSVVADGPQHC